ncbi:MAG: cytochrome c biogenesis protein CcsA, partial [Actinomycetia bacterium]|nr:cytochrome c biogenesis protein CcsA [Actinomycetes bacterium]
PFLFEISNLECVTDLGVNIHFVFKSYKISSKIILFKLIKGKLLDYQSYLNVRLDVINLGKMLSPMIIVFSISLLFSQFFQLLKPFKKNFLTLLNMVLFLGFGFLIWFHLEIFKYLKIIDPLTKEALGRYCIPLWIETEKLFFWLLIFSVMVFLRSRKESLFENTLHVVLSLFAISVALFSNPFLNPLPQFHIEITELNFIFKSADPNILLQVIPQALGRLKYFYNSSYMWMHPPMLFISYASFLISFLASIFMFFKNDNETESIAYNYCKFGYIFLTLGILIGYPWAIIAWKDDPWWWAPKINMTLIMWLLYTSYLHSKLYIHKKGMWKITAFISILAFLTLILTYVTTYLIPGTHSYG